MSLCSGLWSHIIALTRLVCKMDSCHGTPSNYSFHEPKWCWELSKPDNRAKECKLWNQRPEFKPQGCCSWWGAPRQATAPIPVSTILICVMELIVVPSTRWWARDEEATCLALLEHSLSLHEFSNERDSHQLTMCISTGPPSKGAVWQAGCISSARDLS